MNTNFKIEAPHASRVGNTRVVDGSTVEFVASHAPCHIRYQKYTKDYARYNSRPYIVVATGKGYSMADNAVRALLQHGFNPL